MESRPSKNAEWLYLSWKKLENYIISLRTNPKLGDIWNIIESKPLDISSIKDLKRDGLKIEIKEANYDSSNHHSFTYFSGVWFPTEKKIILTEEVVKTRTEPRRVDVITYDRDLALFHEIVHAQYEEALSRKLFENEFSKQNEYIVEWLARQARAKFELLEMVIDSFEIDYRTYDLASFLAFGRRGIFSMATLCNNSNAGNFFNKRGIYMDSPFDPNFRKSGEFKDFI